jgi:hypothetical protein
LMLVLIGGRLCSRGRALDIGRSLGELLSSHWLLLYFNITLDYLATFAVSKMASSVFVWSKNRDDIWDGNEYKIRKWLVLKFHGSGHLPNNRHMNEGLTLLIAISENR